MITRGFHRRREDAGGRLPPGQYLEHGFPVLSAGPTPHTPLDAWDFQIAGAIDPARRWTWEELQALPREDITVDIHCVTTWSKLERPSKAAPTSTRLVVVALLGSCPAT